MFWCFSGYLMKWLQRHIRQGQPGLLCFQVGGSFGGDGRSVTVSLLYCCLALAVRGSSTWTLGRCLSLPLMTCWTSKSDSSIPSKPFSYETFSHSTTQPAAGPGGVSSPVKSKRLEVKVLVRREFVTISSCESVMEPWWQPSHLDEAVFIDWTDRFFIFLSVLKQQSGVHIKSETGSSCCNYSSRSLWTVTGQLKCKSDSITSHSLTQNTLFNHPDPSC